MRTVVCYLRLFGKSLLFLFFFAYFARLGYSQVPQLMVRGKLQYVHGVNIGWMFSRYSCDIGLNPFHPDWGNGYDSTTADLWLNDIQQMNVNVIRLWLFEGLEGLTFDADGYVSGLQQQFLDHLDDLMDKANNYELAYELVMLTHSVGKNIGKILPNGATVKNMLVNSAARNHLLNKAVKPLAMRYAGNLALFSFDIMNESDLGVYLGVCTRTQLRVFIKKMASTIHKVSPECLVTSSCSDFRFSTKKQHAKWYGGLGLDYYENHNYATELSLSAVPDWLDAPLLLGEYGPDLSSQDYTGSNWTDDEQNRAAEAHIRQAMELGWAGSLAWMYWHDSDNGENIVYTPGGQQDWEPAAKTIRDWGTILLGTRTESIFTHQMKNGVTH